MFQDHTLGTSMSDQAYGTYQAWVDNVLEFRRQASRSGTKLQMRPIRNAMLWKNPTLPVSGDRMQGLPLRSALDWPIRSGLGGVPVELGPKGFMLGQGAVVAVPVQRAAVDAGSLVVGLIAGWVIGKALLK